MNRPSLRPKSTRVEDEEEDEQHRQRSGSQQYLYNEQMQYYVAAERSDVSMDDYFPPQTYPLSASSTTVPTLRNNSTVYAFPEDYQYDNATPDDIAMYTQQGYPVAEDGKQRGFVEPSIYSPPVPPPPPLIHAASTLSNSTDDMAITPTGPFVRPIIEDQGYRAERRRAQNRAAQRAYRQRKEQTLKKRDDEIDRLRIELEESQKANEGLVAVVSALKEKLKDP